MQKRNGSGVSHGSPSGLIIISRFYCKLSRTRISPLPDSGLVCIFRQLFIGDPETFSPMVLSDFILPISKPDGLAINPGLSFRRSIAAVASSFEAYTLSSFSSSVSGFVCQSKNTDLKFRVDVIVLIQEC